MARRKRKKTRRRGRFFLRLAVLALIIWGFAGSLLLSTHRIRIESEKLPRFVSGFTIAQLSDLCGSAYGEGNSFLLSRLEAEKPDLIVLTGNLVDGRDPDIPAAVTFVQQAGEIAPCYFVTGSEEALLTDAQLDALLTGLRDAGATVLRNEWYMEGPDSVLVFAGAEDPDMTHSSRSRLDEGIMRTALASMSMPEDRYRILFSHRPELLQAYADFGYDLVLTGHAKGGVTVFPYLGGLYAPDQGIFPRYVSGLYHRDGTTMAVSRGLVALTFPLRFWDPPELVLIELVHKD